MNFTYKNPNLYDKKYLILKQLEVNKKIKENDEKSIINSLLKKECTKIQDIDTTMLDSKDFSNHTINNNDTDFIDKNIYNIFSINKNIKLNILVNNYDYNTNFSNNDANISNNDANISNMFSINKKMNLNIIVNNNDDNDDNNNNNNNTMVIPYNVERIRNKGVKVLYNVYQSKYSNGAVNGTGLGDFIRGSYFLIEFCDKYNFEPKILFNNYISKFLQNKTSHNNIEKLQPLLKNIEMFNKNNFKEYVIKDDYILQPKLDLENIMSEFVDYIMKCNVYTGNIFIYCIPYPIEKVSEKSTDYMRKLLEPVDEIKCKVQQCLNRIGLKSKQYSVFHIRSGDEYLNKNNKIFYNKYLENLKKEIKKFINNSSNDTKFLIIADNNEIKLLLKQQFPDIKIILKEITHFGEGVVLEEEKIKNTLVDFYLLSFANKIISFSTYKHGSGFSFWCAKTFNIPYVSKYINST